MNNELVFNNYLLILKSSTEVYVHGTLESKNKKVRELLKNGLIETVTNQGMTYDFMTENGWYNVENIKKEEIKKLKDTLEN